MRSHKFLAFGAIFGFLVLILIFVSLNVMKSENKNLNSNLPTSQVLNIDVEKKASFAIFTNGVFRIFTDPRYHNKSQDVYIEGPEQPNVITVKKEGITWKDFFKTLPMSLTSDCLTTGTKQTFCTGEGGALGFYVNGERVGNVLDREISDGDKLLVSFGSQNEAEIKSQLSQIPSVNQ